jgi:NTP pyrophosphatase (non-canonical NTP hydrolase)
MSETKQPKVTKDNANWNVEFADVLTVVVPLANAAKKEQAISIAQKSLKEYLELTKKSK